MDVRIAPFDLHGKITAPPSKSAAHRAAICAALASGQSRISNIEATKDMLATIGAIKALGAKAELEDGDSRAKTLCVSGLEALPASCVINCGESGSTLRFFVPIAAALGVSASFRGEGRLPLRPMDELISVLENHGIKTAKENGEILSISGKLKAGVFEISGSVSSQYITGLLFALPLLDENSEIILTTPLQSRGYVDMTIATLKRFGVRVAETSKGFKIPGKQKYQPQDLVVEGDYSSAAFFLCAATLGGSIEMKGLTLRSKQGDMRILRLLTDVGAQIKYGRGFIKVERSGLKGFDADVSQIPDLMPILAVVAAFSNGVCRLYNASRLRLKESDRLHAVAEGLNALGASVIDHGDELEIIGAPQLRGGAVINSYNDHRIAMSMSIAAAYCRDPSVISGAECVDKSYPDFYKDFAALGGLFNVV